MKTLILLTCSFICQAADQNNQTREIIGSGIFDVNKTRTFVMDDNSLIYFDEEQIDLEFFEIIGSGFTATFTVKKDTTESVESGIINALELNTYLKGPVTSINPLKILEQPVLETSDTVKAYPNQLLLNQNVAVSGYLSTNNSLKAGRVMLNDSDWKVRGFASQVNANFFKIGTLQINRSSELLLDCDNGFNNGTLVEVKMSADENYQPGVAIDTIQSIRCLTGNRLANEKVELPSVIQGFVSQTQGQNFWLDDIKVNVSNNTQIINGENTFVDDSVNVEVQGIFNSTTSELQAEVIRFIEHRFEITFPVQPEDVVLGESITLLGTTYYLTPQTKDNANVLSNELLSPIQLQIQGFLDSSGRAYITKTLDKGDVDYNAVSLRGNISNLNSPEFTLLNVVVDATDSLIINPGIGVIDIQTFFSEAEDGAQVDIRNAQYDDLTGKFSNGMITIRDINRDKSKHNTKEIIGSGIFGAFMKATISSTADQLFISGFE